MPLFSKKAFFEVDETANSAQNGGNVFRISRELDTIEEESRPTSNGSAKISEDEHEKVEEEENGGISYVTMNREGISDNNQGNGIKSNSTFYNYNYNSKNTDYGVENVGKWSSHNFYRIVMFVSLVGFASWWRFPATAYDYNEGTFVFVYIILWLFIGVPISLLEQALGQFSGRGPFRVWSCVPLFRGLAFAQCASSLYIALIFGALVSYCGLFFASALHQNPVWDSNPYSTALVGSENFFRNEILHLAPLENISHVYWQTILSFAACWVLVTLMSICKINIFEKLMIVPCVVFFVGTISLFVYACTMDNIRAGALHFIQPQWDHLKDGQVWYAALTQLVFTEVIGLGVLISFSSRNEFQWHLYISSSVCSLVGLLVCVCLGIANFCIVSHFSKTNAENDPKPVKLGYGLMFISILETTRNIDAVSARFWTALVFALLFVAGLGCCATALFNMKSMLIEIWPSLKRVQSVIAVALGVACMALSVPFATEGGFYLVAVTDVYGVSAVAVGCLFFETLGLTWIYGTNSLFDDFQLLAGWAIFYVWVVSIATAAPVLILAVVVFCLASYEVPTLDGAPIAVWGHVLGGVLIAVPFVLFVGHVVYASAKQIEYGIMGKLKSCARPSLSWGPTDVHSRGTWLARKAASYKYKNLGDGDTQNGIQANGPSASASASAPPTNNNVDSFHSTRATRT